MPSHFQFIHPTKKPHPGALRKHQYGWKQRWWQSVQKESSGSTYSHGHFHGGDFQTTYRMKDGAESWSADQGEMRPLLISMSLEHPDGTPWQIERSYSSEFLHVDDRLVERSQSRWIKSFGPEIIGDEAAELLKQKKIALHIQHLDPDVGWIALSGPLWIGEEFPSHHVAALPVWRRDLKVLEFRAIRDTGEVLHFQLPNPPTPAGDLRSITPEPFPVVRTGDDYEVRLEEITITRRAGEYHKMKCEPSLTSPRYTIGNAMSEHLAGNTIGIRDEMGNFSLAPRYSEAGYIHPKSERFELLYRVRRGEGFPRPEADCFIVAEGIVSPDGTSVEFSLLPDAEVMGVSNIAPIEIIPDAEDSYFGPPGSNRKLPIRIEGTFPNAVVPPRFGNLDHSDHPRIVVFEDDAGESSGMPRPANSSVSSSSLGANLTVGSRSKNIGGEKIQFSVNINWHAPPGALDAGRRIRLGLATQLRTDVHVLPFEAGAHHHE